MNKSNLAKIYNEVQTAVAQHSPGILMGIGIAGMITTTVLAVKATPKALDNIEKRKDELDTDALKPVEVVKSTWKCYIPAATTGVFSIACLIGSNSVHTRRNAAIATAYKISETALTEYRDKVVETIGEKKEKQVREKVDKERIEKNPVSNNQIIITGKGTTRCYDHLSGRYFESDIERIRRAVNNLNKELLNGMGYASLNDFYSELDLDYTGIGEKLGWNVIDGLVDIDFSSQISEDGVPCIVIDYKIQPRYGYSSYR